MPLGDYDPQQPRIECAVWFEGHRGMSDREARPSRRRDSGVVESGKESRRDVGGEDVNLVWVLTVGKDDVDLSGV